VLLRLTQPTTNSFPAERSLLMENMINYNKASSTYDNTRSHSDILISRFAERISFSGSTTILDFGCGKKRDVSTSR